ncbi:MAG: hypothetical protein F2808_03130 [Actinobacteria bacterium]|uniref:Unannotated protein n=1 Tax=freshwater metagenome TaxID=449393 RepID=A0A6J7FH58_9ZZZZ|nr:hypothetical protein [Actinomycetota bacterium]
MATSNKNVLPVDDDTRLRQLALIDRIIALEVENARLRIQAGQPAQHLMQTTTWRVGSAIVSPLAKLRRVFARKQTRSAP